MLSKFSKQVILLIFSFLLFLLSDHLSLTFAWITVCVSVVLFILFLFRDAAADAVIFVLSVQTLFMVTLSGLLIESGAYISEQLRDGYPTGSSIRFLLYGMTAATVAVFVFQYQNDKWRIKKGGASLFQSTINPSVHLSYKFLMVGGIIAGSLIMTVLTFVIVKGGTAYSQGLDRVSFRAVNLSGILGALYSYMIQSNVVWGMLVGSQGNHYSRVGWTLFVWQIVLQILSGERYSGILMSGLLFYIGGFSKFSAQIKNIQMHRKIYGLIIAFLVLGFLLGLLFFNFDAMHTSNESTYERMQMRLVLDGHVWWGIDEYVSNAKYGSGPGLKELEQEVVTALSETPFVGLNRTGEMFPRGVGMDLLMDVVSPPNVVEHYREIGYRFSNGFAPNLVYIFGWFGGWIALVIISALFGSAASLMVFTTSRGSIVGALVVGKLFPVFAEVSVQSGIHRLFSPRTVILLGILILMRSHYWNQINKWKSTGIKSLNLKKQVCSSAA